MFGLVDYEDEEDDMFMFMLVLFIDFVLLNLEDIIVVKWKLFFLEDLD